MLGKLTDKQNSLLNKLAYKNITGDFKPGENLYDVLKDIDSELANEFAKEGLGTLKIKDYVNNNSSGTKSGFCAIAFEDPITGAVGMSFRGTENLGKWDKNQVDMIDNLLTATGGVSPQSLEAIAFFEKNENKEGNNYLYGHSKGGELAAEVYAVNYQNIKQIHLINPQPINKYKLSKDQILAFKSNKVDAIVIDGDIVWSLGGFPYSARFSNSNKEYTEEGFFKAHDIDALVFGEDGSIDVCSFPFLNYPLQGLTVLVEKIIITCIQAKIAPFTFVLNVTLRIINFIVNDLPELATEFINKLIDTIEAIKLFTINAIQELKEFCDAVYKSISQWYNSTFNEGYKYATANPSIVVDTYKLYGYSNRLDSINRRISDLDSRLNSLYWGVCDLEDLLGTANALWNLIQADALTSYSFKLRKCSSYLENTAEDFEKAEKKVLDKAQ